MPPGKNFLSLSSFNKHQYFLLIIIIVAIIMRVLAITVNSLWWDELQSVRTADPSNSFSDILLIAKQSYDPAPRTFYFLLNVWFRVTGFNDFTARLFPLLFGVAAIPIMYGLGKQLLGRRLGLIAAALTAVNYFHIFHSLEVRFYSLLFFFSALSFLFFLRSVKRSSYFNLIVYALSTVLLMSIHYFGIFIFIVQGISWIFLVRRSLGQNFRKHLPLMLTFLVVILIYLPFVPRLLNTMQTSTAALSGNPGNDFFIRYFEAFLGYSSITVVPAALALLFFVVVVFLFPTKKINTEITIVVFLWLLLPLALAYLRTIFGDPTMGERYFIIILPALLIMMSLGIHFIESGALRFAFLSFFILASIVNLTGEHRFYSFVKKDDFRGVAQYISKVEESKKFNILSDKNWHFKYYFDQNGHKPRYIDHQDYSDARFYLSKTLYNNEQLLQDTSVNRIWVISAHFANLEKMKTFSQNLVATGSFIVIDSFDSKDAFARLLSRKGSENQFSNYIIPLPADQYMELDNEKLFPIWSGEVILNTGKLPSGSYTMTITSKATAAKGEYPSLSVFVNERKIGHYIGKAQLGETVIHFNINEEDAAIRLMMENDLWDPVTNEDRNFYIRSIVLKKRD